MSSVLLSGSTFHVLDSPTNPRVNGIAPNAGVTAKRLWKRAQIGPRRIGGPGSALQKMCYVNIKDCLSENMPVWGLAFFVFNLC